MLDAMFMLVMILLALVGIAYLRKVWQDGRPQREHNAMKVRLGGYRYDHDDLQGQPRDVAEMTRHNLEFAGVPDLEGGDILTNVPCLDVNAEGRWSRDQPIVTVSRIKQLTKDGPVSIELIELGANGYVVLVKGQKVFVLKRYNMTNDQEQQLIREREDACKRADGQIESFLGKPWTIVMASGDMRGEYSTIQLLSTHPRIGQEGFISVLPPEIMDQESHHYFDLEAKSPEGDVMVGFYCKGGWTLLIGRALNEDERQALHTI